MTSAGRYISFLALLVACSSSETSRHPTRAQCEAARAREAELAVAAAATPGDDDRTRAELAKHRETRASLGGDAAIDRCVAADSVERVACVTGARDVDGLKRCPPAP